VKLRPSAIAFFSLAGAFLVVPPAPATEIELSAADDIPREVFRFQDEGLSPRLELGPGTSWNQGGEFGDPFAPQFTDPDPFDFAKVPLNARSDPFSNGNTLPAVALKPESEIRPQEKVDRYCFNTGIEADNACEGKHYSTAASLYERMARATTDSANRLWWKGKALLCRNQKESAAVLLEESFKITPNWVMAQDIHNLYVQLKRPDESRIWCARVNGIQWESVPPAPIAQSKAEDPVMSSEQPFTAYERETFGFDAFADDVKELKVFFQHETDEPFNKHFEKVLWKSLKDWTAASRGILQFKQVKDIRDANIICKWEPRFDKWDSRLGQTRPSISEKLTGNEKCAFVLVFAKGDDSPLYQHGTYKSFLSEKLLKAACLHEIGHALGFCGHSSVRSDLMFPALDPHHLTSKLSKRDKMLIYRMYRQRVVGTHI
jgi:hypothetical protein